MLQHLFSGQLKIPGDLTGRDLTEQNGNDDVPFHSGKLKESLPQDPVPLQTNGDKERIQLAQL